MNFLMSVALATAFRLCYMLHNVLVVIFQIVFNLRFYYLCDSKVKKNISYF